MSITTSSHLLVVQTDNNIQFVDPKTSSVLQVFNTSGLMTISENGYLLACSTKNVCTAFDLKGIELWKQHLTGDAVIVQIFDLCGIVLVIYKNKEVKIYNHIAEDKIILDIAGSEVSHPKLSKYYLSVVDDLQNCNKYQCKVDVYLFLLDDLLNHTNPSIKPFRVFKGNKSTIVDLIVTEQVLTISMDKQFTVFDITTSQIQYQTQLDSDPKSLQCDLEYAFIGCSNRNIYQIKINQLSNSYTIQPSQSGITKKVLIGHLSEVIGLSWHYDEGEQVLISCSSDGQIFFWLVNHSQPKLLKKILTMKAEKIHIINRPYEYKQQSEDEIFFKHKRSITLKPLKKTKYSSLYFFYILHQRQQVQLNKKITKIKINFKIVKNQSTVVDPIIDELLKENLQLKKLFHQLV